MEDMILTTFPNRSEFDRALERVRQASFPHEIVSCDPGFSFVGVPSVVFPRSALGRLAGNDGAPFSCSGWVDYRAHLLEVPPGPPPAFDEDVFGRASVMVLAPCMADETRIRIIAHISGDLTNVFPYMNAEMHEACYNKDGPTFTFRDGTRMVSLYPRRIAVAKADEIVDAWRVLESVRLKANKTWKRRAEIEPSFEMREKPPALEILKRLPRTNCRACGERTCLAFAVRVRAGEMPVRLCSPVFAGDHHRLKDALVELCAGLGAAKPVE
jgi:ArsR family metal-binding transcriptional regulator